MTNQDRIKFEPILNTILDTLKGSRANQLIFNISYPQLVDLVKTAKRKNKLNNYLLKNSDNSTVSVFNCLDTDKNELVNIAVRPNEQNTVKQLFIYEVLNNQFATKQEYTYFKNNVL